MNEKKCLKMIEPIFQSVLGSENLLSLDEILEKYAFDVKLPKKVQDSTTGEVTWADSIRSARFITNQNMMKKDEVEGWMMPRKNVQTLQDVLTLWDAINFTTTERVYDSVHVAQSDTIYRCQDVYRSTGCSDCSQIVFCDSCLNSAYLLACQRSNSCNYCIRTDDSKDCSNCYNVICSSKIRNSFFIQDCFDLDDCMFCSHISSKRFCIANMQFEQEEYYEIKKVVQKWIASA